MVNPKEERGMMLWKREISLKIKSVKQTKSVSLMDTTSDSDSCKHDEVEDELFYNIQIYEYTLNDTLKLLQNKAKTFKIL